MADHGARAHDEWSASASARNWACQGALQLISLLDLPDKESRAAAWGTACHQVSEKCLTSGKDAADFLETVEKTKESEIDVDEELAETAQVYIDYVRGRMAEYKAATGQDAILLIEERFSLARINPPIRGGGTGDAVLFFPLWQLLEIVDLKGGRGVVVEAEGNKQIRTYMLGALLGHPDWACLKVKGTIVQPRAHHAAGRTRSQEMHVADLVEWTQELLAAMTQTALASAGHREIGQRGPEGDQDYTLDDWVTQFLRPGNHCANTFCAAQATCPALKNKVMHQAKVFFDVLGEPRLDNNPDKMMPEEIAEILDMAEMIEGWINAVQAYGHRQAEMGVVIPNYQLVAKQARAKASDEATPQELSIRTGVAASAFVKDKLLTITELKRILKKDWNKVEDLFPAQSSGTNLVRSDKTDRPAVQSSVGQFFSILD